MMQASTSDTFLSAEEIRSLTSRKVRPAQVRVLRSMGIEHRVRPDGSVAILRNHITRLLDGHSTAKTQRTTQPNWEAI